MNCEMNLADGSDGELISNFDLEIGTSDEVKNCSECNREIPAGAEREIVTGDFDDKPIEWHACMDCHHIGQGLSDGSRIHGTLWDEMEETGGEGGRGEFEHFTSACLLKIETSSAKAYVVERFNKWKGLAK